MSGWTANINSRIAYLERRIEKYGLEDDPVYQDRLDALYAERDRLYAAAMPDYECGIELGRGGFGT